MPPSSQKCKLCGEEGKGMQRCAGCQKVYYCSRQCQKHDWVEHIFNCKTQKTITTAHHLALAVRRNVIPEHPQTCEDYGFNKVPLQGHDRAYLLGLYIGLIERMAIKPIQIHKWRVEGTLSQHIKAEYEGRLPPGQRGGYYPWFLEHQYVLDAEASSRDDSEEMAKATVIQAWKFTGVPACDSEEDAVSPAHLSMPPEQAFPHLFYGMLLTGQRPGPGLEIYISLGFCTCRDQGEEHGLANTYRLLIDKCTFPEFCDAFASQSLGQLLETHDLTSHLPRHFASATALSKPSVWYLKDFVLQDNLVLDNESDLVKSLQNSVRVDYGFWNAKNLEEIQVLRSAYRQYFDAYGDAVELHNACIQGRIYEHVNSVVRLKSKWLKRLMMNIYPLSSSD